MVLYMLMMKAETEGIGEIKLRTENVDLRISVRNSLSDWEIRENVIVNPSELEELDDENSRESPSHFSLKWEGSKKPSVLRCLDAKETVAALKKKKKYKEGGPRAFTGDDSTDVWVPILTFECRGLEPYEFRPMKDEFVIISEGGYLFDEEIEFEDGEWADYDADNDCPVSISELEFKFEAV
uniref:Uncharacterized protein n=1 Tax=Chaetoceros debilis TaxID=122233 RepID=A0A7S3VGS2_9STRA|mmetsp:Transcript_26327/g.40230  ORF Transcript_26327/g.40230 Transcript_26327/m.40230 type:complete len:182 (+) Transcript_26327:76-621(+)|eukprot:CAMPEP_0194088642 /NCGR_PEP_ID=MMETSP0149-20130528/30136_1 /TAXON_ID=122233 /ORGANISM="Chaetoceros debilis, Strain MM31A-1" /LENGTH=181 /DNA_ID=CAMNT_0038772343 /DNA_START=73 /DNA_END=618 /DNA_ORIENTATION=-